MHLHVNLTRGECYELRARGQTVEAARVRNVARYFSLLLHTLWRVARAVAAAHAEAPAAMAQVRALRRARIDRLMLDARVRKRMYREDRSADGAHLLRGGFDAERAAATPFHTLDFF